MKTFASTLFLMALVFSAGVAQANLISNGNFETLPQSLGSGSWKIFSSLPNWTLQTGEVEVQNGMFGGNNLSNYVELDANNNVRIGQSVSLTKGATYQLSFDYFNRQQSTTSGSMSVSIGDYIYNTSALGSHWANQADTFVFNGASGSVMVYLAGTGKSDSYGALVDNFSLVETKPAPTPVPGAVWLLGSALVGLVGLKRKRQA